MAKIIGLTGGIATGKSTVSKMLRQKRMNVIDADEIVRNLQKTGRPLLKKIAQTFGSTVLNEDGSLNRAALGQKIFSDEKARAKIDALIHPEVRAECLRQIEAFQGEILFLDVPLLFEAGFDDLTDANVVVSTTADVQLKRLMLRDGMTSLQAQKRMDAQMPISEKMSRADFIINNDGDEKLLEENVEKLLRNLKGIGD